MRDLHLALVCLDPDSILVGPGQGAGEAALSVDRLTGADAHAPAPEAIEVLGLGQWPVGARRRDLERPGFEQVAEMVADALAEREVNSVRMIDVQAKGLTSRLFQRDQLDRGIEVAEPLLDLPLKFVQARSSVVISPFSD